jgi:hypothetical protein
MPDTLFPFFLFGSFAFIDEALQHPATFSSF